ncbi:hypothetical protein JZ751_024012 [Albula glossodonta]|uniref:PLA2c domain-containing protein n=1 Tax=Albula glossodonta TaxID=121402 RepID=A0A8T2MSC4_9TELE|nr:hypothetical protein JZ751_024012 [Albula glossodonta]
MIRRSFGASSHFAHLYYMEIQSGHPQSEYIRVSRSLSESEAKFVAERKVKIAKCLSANGINCEAASVPHIAVLGSGGGERAMVGLLGCLDQMGQDNLLDSTLYLCGVSGSTWSANFFCFSII